MKIKSMLMAALLAALVASGCGNSDGSKDSSAAAAKPDGAQVAQDASAKATARTAVSEMEACYVDAASYAGCKPTSAGAAVSDVTDAGYTLTAKSASGNSFVIAKTADGLARTCTTAGSGGCASGGTW